MTTAVSAPAQPSGLDRRFIAYLLDGLFLAVVSLTVSYGVPQFTFSSNSITDTVARSAILAAASLVYFALTWSRFGGSPGQRALGVRTLNAKDGAMMTLTQAAQRWGWLYGLNSLLFAIALFPGVTSAALGSLAYTLYLYYTTRRDPQRRGFHDQRSGTIVVRAPF